MALWEAEARHARELSVFGEKRALLYTGVCELFLSIYRCARTCPALPGFARTCESSRPDSKPTPHAQVLWKAVAWQSTNSLKLLLLRKAPKDPLLSPKSRLGCDSLLLWNH